MQSEIKVVLQYYTDRETDRQTEDSLIRSSSIRFYGWRERKKERKKEGEWKTIGGRGNSSQINGPCGHETNYILGQASLDYHQYSSISQILHDNRIISKKCQTNSSVKIVMNSNWWYWYYYLAYYYSIIIHSFETNIKPIVVLRWCNWWYWYCTYT